MTHQCSHVEALEGSDHRGSYKYNLGKMTIIVDEQRDYAIS